MPAQRRGSGAAHPRHFVIWLSPRTPVQVGQVLLLPFDRVSAEAKGLQ